MTPTNGTPANGAPSNGNNGKGEVPKPRAEWLAGRKLGGALHKILRGEVVSHG